MCSRKITSRRKMKICLLKILKSMPFYTIWITNKNTYSGPRVKFLYVEQSKWMQRTDNQTPSSESNPPPFCEEFQMESSYQLREMEFC